MKLLLISNSTNAGEPYLKYPMPRIDEFLGSVREVVFVPYAGITFSYAEYEAKVQARFAEYGIKVRSVHRSKDPRRMIREAQAICVGGGNTFALTKKMQEQGLLKAILGKIKAGTPYIGWAVKFQINPHYLDANPEGHAGETREQRILEYITANPRRYVVGLREGCMLHYENGKLELIGSRPMRIFKKGIAPYEVKAGDDLSFLL